jgi:hypothetical protein
LPYDAPITRRRFLGRLARWGLGAAAGVAAWPFVESRFYTVTRPAIEVPRLPDVFDGLTVALLTDFHHGPFWGIDRVRRIVDVTNRLAPDVVALGGDYVSKRPSFIEPCIAELARLRAREGVFAVLGNHDHWESAPRCRRALQRAGIAELRNAGVWLQRGGDRLRLCGVGDLWEDTQDLDAALGDCREAETAVLLSHNPDFVETIRDGRVGLVLSGHTHGGQCRFPLIGAPLVPSDYGEKYAEGLVRTPYTQVYVSRGLGTITPPVRFLCPAELALVTLRVGGSERGGGVR